MHKNTWLATLLLSGVLLFNYSNAEADVLTNFWQNSKISGDVRLYNFTRDYSRGGVPSQNAFAIGGGVSLLTAPILPNIEFGASFYTTQSLSINSDNAKHVDNTLPGSPINVLGETYLQYHTKQILVRAGNQIINTPWLNAADSRMIPATYQGVVASYSPWQNITISGLRIFRFKSRTENGFSRSNLYNTANIGGAGIAAYGDTPNNGALAFGVTQQSKILKSNIWAYRFYDLAKLFFADTNYTFTNMPAIKPQIGIQVLRETGDGDNKLRPFSGGAANAMAFGVEPSISWHNLSVYFGYNDIFSKHSAFNNGNILSPYTAGYSADPLYSTSMMGGLIEKAAGQAIKAGINYNFTEQLKLSASFARYFTAPLFPNTNETDIDATYSFIGKLKGFSVRDRIGVLTGNPAQGRFFCNRIMLQFAF